MKESFKKFRSILITIGILVIWMVIEILLYSVFGTNAVTTIIGLGFAFVIGAYFFHKIKEAWKV